MTLATPRADIRDAIFATSQDKAHLKSRVSQGVNASKAVVTCPADAWLTLRWATLPVLEGRMHRLFARGEREEAVVVEALRNVGCEIDELDPATGQQWAIEIGNGWIRGKCDGIIRSANFPGMVPPGPGVLEIKTHNTKSFSNLANSAGGVRIAKPEHYTQMQLYMHALDSTWALYVAVNKNDDDIYVEMVRKDQDHISVTLERIKDVILAQRMPEPVSPIDSFTYKFSDNKPVLAKVEPGCVSCRSCCHVTFDIELPPGEGGIRCDVSNKALTIEEQQKACRFYLTHPDMHEGKQIQAMVSSDDAQGSWVKYELAGGVEFTERPGDRAGETVFSALAARRDTARLAIGDAQD